MRKYAQHIFPPAKCNDVCIYFLFLFFTYKINTRYTNKHVLNTIYSHQNYKYYFDKAYVSDSYLEKK